MISMLCKISACDKGLVIHLPKAMVDLACAVEDTSVRITVVPGRIVIEAATKSTLEDMLSAYDPEKHGGELMASSPIGVETFA